jgi:hypothetical protein
VKIIQVAVCEVKTGQNLVHHPLTAAAHVAEAERHLSKLKEAEGCDDGSFLLVLWPHQNLPVTPAKAKEGEEERTSTEEDPSMEATAAPGTR